MPSARDDLLGRLRRFPERLRRLVEQQPEDILRQAGSGGGWGAVEILAYLRDWDEVVTEHVDQILSEGEPALTEYDTDLWAIERDYAEEDPFEVIDQFEQLRDRLVDHLSELPDAQWQRTGVKADDQRVTLEDLIRELEAHDQQNLNTLRDLLL
jgi:hypothetical protein